MYQPGEYDLAGFAVGIVDNLKIIDGSEIRVGHQLIGIPSSGLHSNGYSLVRKICFDKLKMDVTDYVPDLEKTLGEELLTPTCIYVETVQSIIKNMPIHGISHITGGGLAENITRIIPDACGIMIDQSAWERPPIFPFLQKAGNIEDREMMRTFNNGIGMVVIVPEQSASDVMLCLSAMHESPCIIGEVTERKAGAKRVQWK